MNVDSFEDGMNVNYFTYYENWVDFNKGWNFNKKTNTIVLIKLLKQGPVE